MLKQCNGKENQNQKIFLPKKRMHNKIKIETEMRIETEIEIETLANNKETEKNNLNKNEARIKS